jgi:hypothetical protein
VQSRAPEYSGSQGLPPVSDPRTLLAIAGEPTAPSTVQPTASSAAPAAPVPRLPGTPDLTKEGLYSFTGGGLELLVDPRSGSAVRLTLDGKDALIAPEPKPENYTTELEGSTLVLKAGEPAGTRPSAEGGMTKRFRLDTARRSVEITYTLVNSTSAPLHASVAAVHRVASGTGLTFFPGTPRLLPGSTLKLNVWQPIVWFAHEQAREPKAVEATVESLEGWVATVNDGLILIKVVSDAAHPVVSIASAYDAATKLRPWVEVGAKSSVDVLPRASATCNVRLFVRKLPANLATKPGNQELVGFVRGVIQ